MCFFSNLNSFFIPESSVTSKFTKSDFGPFFILFLSKLFKHFHFVVSAQSTSREIIFACHYVFQIGWVVKSFKT